jgi:hypothetical protein
MTIIGQRCRFCGLVIATAPQFCSARTLIPGERFPHEIESDGDRMVRELATGRFRGGRKRK